MTTVPTRSALLAMAEALTIVIDATAEKAALSHIRGFGGGWKLGVDLWETQAMPYLVLCASSRKRIKHKGPLVIMGQEAGLVGARACHELDDVECAWVFLCSDETRSRVMPAILADVAVGGCA